ncbi:hypothetical protein TRSC58_01810 [Trypanosoma rangeli SC58]|uniref:Uncharacterized protein n=1 Tax=Trypanosoma rangeli SC58 TaxID=429131 RepID=A0A061JAY9_TRYRA|nr:hypothetical protein TRSC58_01810 [Trypanosoma rangeli SC58]
MGLSGLGAVVVVLCILIFGVILFLLCTSAVRQRQLAALENIIEERRQQRAEAALRDNDRSRSRRLLMRRAIEQVVESGVASYGITLVSVAHGTEVLADRRLRSYRNLHGSHHAGDNLVVMQDGTRATVSSIVAMIREEPTPPPDATPGPTILQMLVGAASRSSEDGVARSSEPVETLLQQLHDLQQEEEDEMRKEKEKEKEALQDADEVYGKGLPYVLNPANESIIYFVDGCDDYEQLLQLRERERSTSTLGWLFTPLLKRKNGVSFENPGRVTD